MRAHVLVWLYVNIKKGRSGATFLAQAKHVVSIANFHFTSLYYLKDPGEGVLHKGWVNKWRLQRVIFWQTICIYVLRKRWWTRDGCNVTGKAIPVHCCAKKKWGSKSSSASACACDWIRMGCAVRYARWWDNVRCLIEGTVKELVKQTEAGDAVMHRKIININVMF